MSAKNIPIIVLGGSGYVAGELTRLLVQHPAFDLLAVVSTSAAGQPIADTFQHLAPAVGSMTFASSDEAKEMVKSKRTLGLFSSLPHGEAASLIADWTAFAEGVNCDLKVVDLSADFRFSNADEYEKIYGKPHPAPELLGRFTCALPDLPHSNSSDFVSHPGCFTTSVVLALAPLFDAGLISPEVVVSAITGSTGAGRQPRQGTHHPERHGGLWAYEPLRHRHKPEMEGLIQGASGTKPSIAFIPHSGPFARGIHSSIVTKLTRTISDDDIRSAIEDYYKDSSFVKVRQDWPSVKDVVGTNMCHLAVRKEGDELFIASVIDNLTKGAAGGGVQWMNEIFAYDKSAGLMSPGLGWY